MCVSKLREVEMGVKSVEQTFLLFRLSELSGKHAAEHRGSFLLQTKKQHNVLIKQKILTPTVQHNNVTTRYSYRNGEEAS